MTGIGATYRDNRKRLRAVPGAFPPPLADFLETDVRDSLGRCDELLAGVAGARRGTPFETYGNLYVLTAGPDGAVIENGYDADVPPLCLTLDELASALGTWRRAID